MKNQIKRFFEQYPNIDGVFLDQVCYQMIDYAHADGKSACDCRPVSRYGDSYNETLQMIADYLHNSGRSLWGNGPFNIDIAKHLDGMMSEGTGSIVRSFQYLTCGSKGLLVHSYAKNAADVEAMFKNCLICGGNWSISGDAARAIPASYTAQIEELFDRCGKLVDLLTGCQWVLEPDPFSLPETYEGNLFVLPDGNLALTIVSRHDSMLRKRTAPDDEFEVTVKCSSNSRIKAAEFHTTNGRYDCQYELDGETLRLKINQHQMMSAVLLKCN